MGLPFFVIFGFLIQFIIYKYSRKAGAWFGYVITSFILLFGLTAYKKGNYITLVGLELPIGIFVFLCLLWYSYNTYKLIQVYRTDYKLNLELLKDERIIKFYQLTMDMWGKGVLNELSKLFQKESKLSYNEFIKYYGPYEGGGFEIFLSKYPPLDKEFFIGLGEKEWGKDRFWFILTNCRLLIKDGISLTLFLIEMSDIESFTTSGNQSKSFTFKLKSGENKEINNLEIYPDDKFLKFAINEMRLSDL